MELLGGISNNEVIKLIKNFVKTPTEEDFRKIYNAKVVTKFLRRSANVLNAFEPSTKKQEDANTLEIKRKGRALLTFMNGKNDVEYSTAFYDEYMRMNSRSSSPSRESAAAASAPTSRAQSPGQRSTSSSASGQVPAIPRQPIASMSGAQSPELSAPAFRTRSRAAQPLVRESPGSPRRNSVTSMQSLLSADTPSTIGFSAAATPGSSQAPTAFSQSSPPSVNPYAAQHQALIDAMNKAESSIPQHNEEVPSLGNLLSASMSGIYNTGTSAFQSASDTAQQGSSILMSTLNAAVSAAAGLGAAAAQAAGTGLQAVGQAAGSAAQQAAGVLQRSSSAQGERRGSISTSQKQVYQDMYGISREELNIYRKGYNKMHSEDTYPFFMYLDDLLRDR